MNILVVGDPKSPLIDALYDELLKVQQNLNLFFLNPYEDSETGFKIKLESHEFFYDHVHIHYLSYRSLLIIHKLLVNKEVNLIVSVWGSDLFKDFADGAFLRRNLWLLKHGITPKALAEMFQRVNQWTVANVELIDVLKTTFRVKNINIEICRFGSKLVDLPRSNEEAKPLVITVGYNGRPNQQHIEVIRQLTKLEDRILKNVQFAFPMPYGGSKRYRKKLSDILSKSGLNYFVIESFLSEENLAKQMSLSSIFIQLQKTDQFSATMLEYMYFKNLVITGKWLPYNQLRRLDLTYWEIDTIDNLTEVLSSIIAKIDYYRIKTDGNSRILRQLISWEFNIKAWQKIYL